MNMQPAVAKLNMTKGVIILSLMAIALFVATFTVAGVVNVRNIFLVRCLATATFYRPEFGYLGQAEPIVCPELKSTVNSLDIFGHILKDSSQIREQQNRVSLLFPDWFEDANEGILFPIHEVPTQTLLGELILQSRQGNHAAVLQIVSSAQLDFGNFAPLVSDQVVLAETDFALAAMDAGEWTAALAALFRAIQEQPEDLLALYLAQKAAGEIGDFTTEASIHRKLAEIGLSSFEFSDMRRVETTAQAIVHLLQDGIWDAPRAYSMVSSLIWKSPDQYAEALLRTMLTLQSERAEWQVLRQELESRRTIASIPDSQTNTCTVSRGIGFRDDLFPGGTELIIARELGIDISLLSSGPNLVPRKITNTLELKREKTLRWHPASMIGYQGYGKGEMYSGIDDLCGNTSDALARMSGLWSDDGRAIPPWTGWWLWDAKDNLNYLMRLENGALYAFSFDYRTKWTEDNVFSLWLNDEPAATGQLSGEHYFEGTDGIWRSAVVVGHDAAKAISPLFRLRGKGQVWIDNIQLRQISVSGAKFEPAYSTP